MDPMSPDVARAAIQARLAAAHERREGRLIEQERRAARRHRARAAMAAAVRRLRGRAARVLRSAWPTYGADGGNQPAWRVLAGGQASTRSPGEEVAALLDAAGHRIAERGTGADRALLEAMSLVVARTAPGAAAALVDPLGSEASRQRAFGLVHAHLVDELGPAEHACLLDLLGAAGYGGSSGLVA